MKQILDDNFFVVFCGDIFELFTNKWSILKNGEAKWIVEWMLNNPKRFVYVVGNHDADLWEEEENLSFPIYETVKVHAKQEILPLHTRTPV